MCKNHLIQSNEGIHRWTQWRNQLSHSKSSKRYPTQIQGITPDTRFSNIFRQCMTSNMPAGSVKPCLPFVDLLDYQQQSTNSRYQCPSLVKRVRELVDSNLSLPQAPNGPMMSWSNILYLTKTSAYTTTIWKPKFLTIREFSHNL